MSDLNLCGIDIETTGLNPAKGLPLEIGSIIIDENFKEVARTSYVLGFSLPLLQATMTKEIAAMHLRSGLLKEVGKSAHGLEEVDALLAHWIVSNGGEGVPLFGSSVHFDRKWMERYFPLSLSKLHYRNVDVSVLLEMARRKGWAIQKTPPERIAHRAIPDIETSIGMLKFFDKCFLQGPPDEFKEPFWISQGGTVERPADVPKEAPTETKVEEVKPSGETRVTPIGTDVSKAGTGGGATRVTTVLTSEPVKMRSVDVVPPPEVGPSKEEIADEMAEMAILVTPTGDGGL